MERTEVRITGLGGQGVILLGYVLGKTAAIHGGRHAVLCQSFGPEARGSACAAQVVIDEERIAYPYVRQPQYLIALSQDGYDAYVGHCAGDGTAFIEKELVRPIREIKHMAVDATRIAETVGRRLLLNMAMLGFFGRHTGLFELDAYREAVRTSVPKGTEAMNLDAFQRGWETDA